jgi:serine/threonine-protein kinase
MKPAPGSTFGPYEIVQSLGGGGMGEVYRARDTRLGRDLALKFLRADLAESRLQLHRFEREARAASALNHPSIITIYEVGEHDGHPYIAMEYVDGRRLRDVLAEGPLPVDRGLEVAVALADALAVAHEKGIIHRDLKPENVMTTPAGRVKILDFGLAKPVDTGPVVVNSSAATLPGVVIGTAGYMAPEQAKGLPADARSDQFALGTMLYEIFSGRSPFRRATSMETISAILRDTQPPLNEGNPNIPEELAAVVDRCLAKDPLERYGSTADLAHDLRQIHKRFTTATQPVAALPRVRRLVARSGTVVVASILVVLALATLMIVARPSEREARVSDTPAVPLPERKFLLVVPFREMSDDPQWHLKAEGISDNVAASLGHVPSLQVIPPSSIPSSLDRSNIKLLAREFGATIVLTATVSRSAERMRITFALLDPQTGVQLAAGLVDGLTSDLWAAEDRLAERIATTLDIEATRTARSEGDLLSPAAQDSYMIAAGALLRYDDPAMIDRAIKILEPLADSNPRSALVHSNLGRAYHAKYELTKDPAWAERAISTSRKASRLNPSLPEVHVTLGRAFLLRGNEEEAIRELKRALELRPDDPDAMLALGRAYEKSSPPEAEETFKRAIAIRPAYWTGYSHLGWFYFNRGEYDDAKAMFTKVAELTPDNSRGLSNLGGALFRQGRFEEATDVFRRATEARPDNASAYTNLAFGYYYTGRLREGRAALQKAVALAPNASNHRFNLADTLHALGEKTEARAAYEEGIRLALGELKLNPDLIQTHCQLILAYSRTGDVRRATRHLEKALELQPENADAMSYAALMYFEAGDSAQGSAWLKRALAAGADPAFLARDPALRPFRDDPEVARLLAEYAPPRTAEGRTK